MEVARGRTPRSEDRCAPSQREADSPLRPRTPSRPVLRERARARVLAPQEGEEAAVLERAGLGNSPRRPASRQRRPADRSRPWRGRPRGAHAPRATARIPPWRCAGRFAEAAAGSGSGPALPGLAALACGPGRPARPRPAPPRCATLPKLEAEPRRLHSRRAHGGGEGGSGGGGGGAAPEGEATPARQGTDRGRRRRLEQQKEELEEDARRRRRRRPARESKVGAGGCAQGPGGAVARAPARRALAGRMGGGAPGPPPPPSACASAQRRGRGAAGARPLGRCVAVGSRPGRSP